MYSQKKRQKYKSIDAKSKTEEQKYKPIDANSKNYLFIYKPIWTKLQLLMHLRYFFVENAFMLLYDQMILFFAGYDQMILKIYLCIHKRSHTHDKSKISLLHTQTNMRQWASAVRGDWL